MMMQQLKRQLNTEDGYIVIDRISSDDVIITMKDMTKGHSATLRLNNLKFAHLKAIVDELV